MATLNIQTTIELVVPPVPDNIKRDGDQRAAVPIESLTDDALREIGAAWTSDLINAAGTKREAVAK